MLRLVILGLCVLQAVSTHASAQLSPAVRVTELDLSQSSVDAASKSLSSFISSVIGGGGGGGSGSSGTPGAAKQGDSYGGEGLTFEAVSGKAEYTVILLHGLSAKVQQVAPIVTLAQINGLDRTRFILPQAPDAYVKYRDQVEPSWYNIDGTNPRAQEHEDEILKAAARIDKIIAGEYARGIPNGNVAVVGMSQGGGVALTVYMRSNERLAGVIGLSTYLPLAFTYPDAQSSTNKDVPLLMVHGSKDDVVEIEWARASVDKMKQSGRSVDFKVIEGAPHVLGTSFPKAADFAISYLKDRGLK